MGLKWRRWLDRKEWSFGLKWRNYDLKIRRSLFCVTVQDEEED